MPTNIWDLSGDSDIGVTPISRYAAVRYRISTLLLLWIGVLLQKENIELAEIYFNPMEDKGASPIQIVSSGPNSVREEIKRSMMRMITYAEKTVYLQTPYFIPDPSMLESLKMAAQSGVDVRIMIPCMPDHIFVYWATYAYWWRTDQIQGRVYIYDSGFLHAKT